MSASAELIEHMRDERLEHGESVAHAAGRTGQVGDQRLAGHARRRTTQ
jgi:hypothetical protein